MGYFIERVLPMLLSFKQSCCFGCFCLLLALPVMAEEQADERLQRARELIGHLEHGEAEEAVRNFDAVMARALPARQLQTVWSGMIGQYGPFQKIKSTRLETRKPYEIVLVRCQFQKTDLTARVVFSRNNQISGLFFKPEGEYKRPAYVDPGKFTEEQLTIGEGLWALPGTLSLPVGKGPFPLVILVHGSGPQDRDETVGPNKPFRDLAQGLATRGIAVLRYEKRTRHHRLKMAFLASRITVREETVEDVIAAVKVSARHPRIDAKRIVVLGHSLGGYLLPRIARGSDQIAGLISLAGSVRPLEELILDQTNYLVRLDGTVSSEEEQQLAELKKQVERVRSSELSETEPASALPLGVPAKYWLDLRGYQPAEAARTLSQPLLILQGERDYQVTMADFELWKAALSERKDVKLISYPGLNHLFIAGEGKSQPGEYLVPGHVSEKVMRDIAAWVASLRSL
ncbi:Alpha/beta hydrolase family protein [Gimesia panareensis]|uniref:Alpha/beta hydrolase family protein n=2 Tax=Gimesia panareensis TaxID=2527978 RepID=A0A517Q336_9PLAN|nr:Alpha/beta hydrolase family protein [Gimesia panareensis]QDU48969.1 Alpha/beta hydrolase family protein [Gimesia panareensis]